jgi:FdhE protein
VTPWERRAARARQLAAEHPAAEQLLRFYAEIAMAQGSILAATRSAIARPRGPSTHAPSSGPDSAGSILDGLDPSGAVAALPIILDAVRRSGPPPLRAAAHDFERTGAAHQSQLVVAFCRGRGRPLTDAPATHWFFAHAVVQPFAAGLAAARRAAAPDDATPHCPQCGADPMVSVLRDAGQGARRSLVCAVCLSEWPFRRIQCPSCGEARFDALPVYTADRYAHVRVDACDTCRAYLKTVDVTKEGAAVPEVDELAAASLDLWAEERGYRKLAPNLLRL